MYLLNSTSNVFLNNNTYNGDVNITTWGNSSTLGNFSTWENNNLKNDTLFCQQERSNINIEDKLTRFVFVFIYAIFGFCGIAINSYVVWIIKATHQWRSLTIRLIMYLSVVDIICSLCNFLRLILFFTAKQVRYLPIYL